MSTRRLRQLNSNHLRDGTPAPPVSQLTGVDRRQALDLLQALLAEAMNQSQEKVPTSPVESDDDEDIV